MAVYSMMFMGMAPVGSLLAGSLAGWLGATGTVAAGGAFCLGGGLIFLQRLPGLRGEARELIQAQQVVLGAESQPSARYPDATSVGSPHG